MDQWKPDGFPIPRMTTEFGLQSWCNFDTLLEVFEEEDMSYYSDQAVHREHHQGGESPLSQTFAHDRESLSKRFLKYSRSEIIGTII